MKEGQNIILILTGSLFLAAYSILDWFLLFYIHIIYNISNYGIKHKKTTAFNTAIILEIIIFISILVIFVCGVHNQQILERWLQMWNHTFKQALAQLRTRSQP